MANTQNLKPWKAGHSGNPGGRPKKKPITELYQEMLSDEQTVAAIRKAILKNIHGGKSVFVAQLREMTERVEGKVSQPMDAKFGDISELTDEELQNEIQRLMEKLRAAEHAGSKN